jgi:hypothetical protein
MPINLSQVRTGHAKQLGTQVELRRIPFLFLEPPLPFLFRQTGTLAPILSLPEIVQNTRPARLCCTMVPKLGPKMVPKQRKMAPKRPKFMFRIVAS